MMNLASRCVLILGLGESGLAMARWCARAGARVRVADTRAEPPGLAQLRRDDAAIEVRCGAFDASLLDGVSMLALSPGIASREPLVLQAREAGIVITGEIALFADALAALPETARPRVLAVTGTNGKTTTTALTAAMLQGAGVDAVAAGNISPSILAAWMAREAEGRPLPACWVLELSSFQLENAGALAPDAAVVLNVSDDHLDRHGSLEAYAAIKACIFAGDGVQILNRDDARVSAMVRPGREQITIGTGVPRSAGDFGIVEHDGAAWLVRGDAVLLPLGALPLAGAHNAVNAQAALALCLAYGASLDAVLGALRAFRGLPHRMACVARRADGVAFFDDSKGTNVGATVAALEGLGRPVVLIAGGDGKGQDFTPLREPVSRHARAVMLIGRDAPRIHAALAGCGVPLEHANNLPLAVNRAAELASPGDAVLLSPACASLDMFRNYAHRGEVFTAAVLALDEVEAA